MSELSERARRIRERMDAACARSSRDPNDVTLLAAVKGVPPEAIVAGGVPNVGENKVQELLAKQSALQEHRFIWHFIGVLQSNKVNKLAGNVALIHSVDSIELAQAVSRSARSRSITQAILLEVNTSSERSKAGCAPRDLPALLSAAIDAGSLDVRGLMTIPQASSPERARSSFQTLAALAREHGLKELSMGMTEDFEIAIEEGATIVRVGTGIFGHRH